MTEQKTTEADLEKRSAPPLRHRIFQTREILALASGFVVALILLNFLIRFICNNIVPFDCPDWWPVSVFYLRSGLTWKHLSVAVMVLAFFHLSTRCLFKFKKTTFRLDLTIIIGSILLLSTNLIQGWEMAFVHPIAPPASLKDSSIFATPKRQLYHDATRITSASDFLADFEQMQSELGIHSRTHPPGAVLFFFVLRKILGTLWALSMFIGILSSAISMSSLYGILNSRVGSRIAGFTSLIFILIPSVQIYYAASLDAIIASFLLATLFFFLHRNSFLSVMGSLAALFFASFLTFATLFLPPVLIGYDLIKRRNVWRSAAILSVLGIVYIILYLLTGFNYLRSFFIASHLENPQGFRFFYEPISYIFTRLENISEILLFFGPFLSIMMVRGLRLRYRKMPDLKLLTLLATGMLLLMFATGAFHTGETARACIFILPYLLFPVALYLEHVKISASEQLLILHLVFFQTIVMQIIGKFWW
jgi:hypothetical protein